MPAAIETRGLTKDYRGERGLFNLFLDVEPGEILGFIGPNGAGKTTTIKLLLDLIRPTRGTAAIFGLDSRHDAVAVKRLVGYVPGELPQYHGLRGADIVESLARLRGGLDETAIQTLSARFQLDLGQKFRDYSHGNKQKLMLIQAFMHEPRLLLLDEPTLGLDPLMQQEFFALLRERSAAGCSVFLSSHVLSEVEKVADRVAIIGQGRLLKLGTLAQLRELRVHRVEATFTGTLDARSLLAVQGIDDVQLEDGHLHCSVHGAFAPLLALLSSAGVTELDSQELSLEEVFFGYYQKPPVAA